jgi:hypothetical protein
MLMGGTIPIYCKTIIIATSLYYDIRMKDGKHLILGWCILLRLYYNENDNCYLYSQLDVSLLYTDHTTCFGYIAILRCYKYKNAKNYYNLIIILIYWSLFTFRINGSVKL